MNPKRLLLMLLPGLAPLLVYVVASELYGDVVGLIVALALGLAEFLFLLLFRRKLDGFVALDLGFLLLTGGISLWSGDDLFFKLKPVLMEALLVGILAFSVLGPRNLLLGMVFRGPEGEEILKRLEADAAASRAFRRNLAGMTILLTAHTLLSLASALWMTKEAWAFITGVLLYGILGAWMAWQFLRRWLVRKKP